MIRQLSVELAMVRDKTHRFESLAVTKQVNKVHALEDVYRCLKNDYLPFLVSNGKGKELATLVSVIDGAL